MAVDQQVDRQHQHQHEVKADGDDRRQQVARERDDVARTFEDVLLKRVERGVTLLLDVDVDAAVVEPRLEVGQVMVGVANDAREVVFEDRDLVADRVDEQEADADQYGEPTEVDAQDRDPARERALQDAHERCQDQRDGARRNEDQKAPIRRLAPAPTRRAPPAATPPVAPSGARRPASEGWRPAAGRAPAVLGARPGRAPGSPRASNDRRRAIRRLERAGSGCAV